MHKDVLVVAEVVDKYLLEALMDPHHLHQVVLAAAAVYAEDLVQHALERHDDDGCGHVATQISLDEAVD